MPPDVCLGSDARGKAHVHVVIIGLDTTEHVPRDRRLFAYETSTGAARKPTRRDHALPIRWRGTSQSHLVVHGEGRPINGLSQLIIGSKPIDNGLYIFDAEERLAFLDAESDAAPLLHPFIGAREYLQGGERWILRCMVCRPARLRAFHSYGSASRPFVPTAVRVKASRRSN